MWVNPRKVGLKDSKLPGRGSWHCCVLGLQLQWLAFRGVLPNLQTSPLKREPALNTCQTREWKCSWEDDRFERLFPVPYQASFLFWLRPAGAGRELERKLRTGPPNSLLKKFRTRPMNVRSGPLSLPWFIQCPACTTVFHGPKIKPTTLLFAIARK
jgi:hypothetical protein